MQLKVCLVSADVLIMDQWKVFGESSNLKCIILQKFHTYEELKQAIDEYIDFYNTRRLQKKLKGLTPMEYRNQTLVA